MSLLRAWWRKADEIILAFPRDLPQTLPEIFVSGIDGLHFRLVRQSLTEYAKYTSYYIEGGFIHFELDTDAFDSGALSDLDYYVCGSFNGWEQAIKNPEWKMESCENGKVRKLKVPLDKLSLEHKCGFFKFASGAGKWLEPYPDAPNAIADKTGNRNLRFSLDRTGRNVLVLKFDGACDPTSEIRLKIPQMKVDMRVEAAELLHSIYSSSQLGARAYAGGTEFSIFAPRAKAAYVKHWREGEENIHVIEAQTADGAVWTARSREDLQMSRYVWHIDGDNALPTSHFDVHKSVVDPYANAFVKSSGPAVVKYASSIPTAKKHFYPPSWHDLSIMEIHIRDVLARAKADISPAERLTFEGLSKWLKSPDCYLRKVGVNCIELQPVQEFTAADKADYEWGYMPVGWFAPSSSYATDPKNATQNCDLARLVEAFHDAGIAVIFDVVYNHYGEPNYLSLIDEGYYFETASDGSLMNFSGCGNDIRAKSPMALRLIIESLAAMVEKYGADGFRFDLSELLGFGALREIETAMKKLNPSIILIAEPWSFRGHIGESLRSTGYASWNDGFREFMLSYALGNGNFDGFKYFISGSQGGYASFPAQSVNYLESHDDMCLLDRITTRYNNPSREDLRRYKLAYALVFMSIGIPMAAEGFDIVRTKNGLANTYKNGDANALDYARAAHFTADCDWLRALAAFRLSADAKALRLCSFPADGFFEYFSSDDNSAAAVLFNACGCLNSPRIFAAFNPSQNSVDLPVPQEFGSYRQIADIDRFDVSGLKSFRIVGADGIVTLPPVSFGLWLK